MLSIEEARKILGDTQKSDKEIQELLVSVNVFCSKFLDDYFADKESAPNWTPLRSW